MEADALLEALETTLAPEIKALGGELTIHGHEADAVTHLSVGVDRWRVCLLCPSEAPPGGDNEQAAGVVNYTVQALIQHAEGPVFDKGSSDFRQGASAHAVPLLKRCTQFRLLLQRCQFVRGAPPSPATDADQEMGWIYLGRTVYAPSAELLGLRTYQLAFSFTAGLLLPDFSAEPPLPCLLRPES